MNRRKIFDNNTNYDIVCNNCNYNFKLEGMPSPKCLKVVGDKLRCPNCGKYIHILDNKSNKTI